MIKHSTDRKEIIISILILLGGIALTVSSFCVYYLVKPHNPAALTAICTGDFLYTLFSVCILLKYTDTHNWLLKGFLIAVGYIAVFILVAILFAVFNGATQFIKNNFINILFYAIFTGPCIYIVITLFLLFLAYS